MKILVVDDSVEKSNDINEALMSIDEIKKQGQVIFAESVVEAKRILMNEIFDVLIIDQYLPNHSGERPSPNGGVGLIADVHKRPDLHKPHYIIGLTEFATTTDYTNVLQEHLWTSIPYSTFDESWKVKLISKIRYLNDCKLNEPPQTDRDFDVLIITALLNPEFSQLLTTSDWTDIRIRDGLNTKQAVFARTANPKQLRAIATCQSQMGIAAASTIAAQMLGICNPKYTVMTGITCGIEGNTNIGDVILADPCWEWSGGKFTEVKGERVFEPSPYQERVNQQLIRIAQDIMLDDSVLRAIWDSFAGEKPLNIPKLHIGPLASGASVISDKRILTDIKKHQRKLLGVEMEAYGIMYASSHCNSNTMPFVIKSVCDFGDSKKNDKYQAYCSFVSAHLLKHIIKMYM